jgi:LPXTG-motif cell wall-anchored protein
MKIRYLAGVAVAGALLLPAAPALAATDDIHPVTSLCAPLRVFYGNPDEGKLIDDPDSANGVKSTQFGFVFTGASLVHRTMAPTALTALPSTATVTQVVVTGNPALFKLESSIPGTAGTYSTINLNTYGPNDGKWWSSKIVTGPGSQDSPVATPGDLIGLWSGFTADTRVFSWGFGYANDAGNQTTVKSVTWMGVKTSLACVVPASPLPPKPGGPVKPGKKPSMTPVAKTLPQTGSPVGTMVLIGGIIVVVGIGAVWYGSRRRV